MREDREEEENEQRDEEEKEDNEDSVEREDDSVPALEGTAFGEKLDRGAEGGRDTADTIRDREECLFGM